MLIADELVSALDVSVQAQVINLLLQLQERLQLTVVFVAHDLRLVRHISHRVAVMYLGKIVEISPTEALFAAPRHPYSKALLDAAPELDPARRNARLRRPRRIAQSARSAGRLPVQHALSARVRPLLCRAPAAVGRGTRSLGRLSPGRVRHAGGRSGRRT